MMEGKGWRGVMYGGGEGVEGKEGGGGCWRGHMIRHEHTSIQCTRYYSVGYVQQMCCFVLYMFCLYYFQVSVFFIDY